MGPAEWDALLKDVGDCLAGEDDARDAFELLAELHDAIGDSVEDLAREVPALMGAREAAEELGVKTPNLRKVAGLPDPEQELASGPVWRASDIRALARRRRQKGEDRG